MRGSAGEHSSAGRASALQAEGHRFEPCCSHQTLWPGSSVGLECQPVTLEVEGSSPFRVAIFALVAQSVEHVTENHSVGGSIPPQGTSGSSSVGRAPPCQGGGRESEPRLPLHFLRRNSQAVRRRSAKPLFSSSILDCASMHEPLSI